MSADLNMLYSPTAIEFIVSKSPQLTELIVNYTDEPGDWIIDSRLHNFLKSVCMRGVNVAAKEERSGSEYHFYLATDLSLLTKALHIPHISDQSSYVYITQGPRLEHDLPLMVEMVMAQINQPNSRQPRSIHVALNHVKVKDKEALKKALRVRGLTSFNIKRDDNKELIMEEVTAINMLLEMLMEQQRGELKSISMPKVNLTGIHSTCQVILFPRRHF